MKRFGKGTKISERFFKSENSVLLSTSAWGCALWWRPFLSSTESALTLGSIWMPRRASHGPGGGLNTPFLVFCCARKRSLSFKKNNVLNFYHLYHNPPRLKNKGLHHSRNFEGQNRSQNNVKSFYAQQSTQAHLPRMHPMTFLCSSSTTIYSNLKCAHTWFN